MTGPDVSAIQGGPEDLAGPGIPPDREALRRRCRQKVGDTTARPGYGPV